MSARPSKIGRQAVSYLLAPSTIARLTMLSDASGMSRGKVIDLAVENAVVPAPRWTLADAQRELAKALVPITSADIRDDTPAAQKHWQALGALRAILKDLAGK